jgi:hypothetical protein
MTIILLLGEPFLWERVTPRDLLVFILRHTSKGFKGRTFLFCHSEENPRRETHEESVLNYNEDARLGPSSASNECLPQDDKYTVILRKSSEGCEGRTF